MYTHSTDAGWISRSHRAISPFRLARPSTLEEAIEVFSDQADATFIAGGIDLVRRMRGGDKWNTVIDISSIDGLGAIEDAGDVVRIGALATHWDVETSEVLAARLPDFQTAWMTIGNVRVRMAGTVGGNILAREASYDGGVILGVLGAELVFASAAGEVCLPADSAWAAFPVGGLLTRVDVPVVPNRKLLFDRSLKPMVSAAVAVEGDRHAVGIGCAFPEPVFRTGTGAVKAEELSADLPEPTGNPMGSSAYRRRMVGVIAARAYRALTGGMC